MGCIAEVVYGDIDCNADCSKCHWWVDEEESEMTIYHDYWKGNEVQAVKFLDNLSIMQFNLVLTKGSTIQDIRRAIEENWNEQYKQKYDEDLFNWISDEELMEYIEKRFNKRFKEVTEYYLF